MNRSQRRRGSLSLACDEDTFNRDCEATAACSSVVGVGPGQEDVSRTKKSSSVEPFPSQMSSELGVSVGSNSVGSGSGKKKSKFSFWTNLFKSSKISEGEETLGNASSYESVNSIATTNSFAFVNPKKYRGKGAKGKRIPMDLDNSSTLPRNSKNLDSTSNENALTPTSASASIPPQSNGNGKTRPIASGRAGTLSRIGIKIGLKKKYNLQSCESLEHLSTAGNTLQRLRKLGPIKKQQQSVKESNKAVGKENETQRIKRLSTTDEIYGIIGVIKNEEDSTKMSEITGTNVENSVPLTEVKDKPENTITNTATCEVETISTNLSPMPGPSGTQSLSKLAIENSPELSSGYDSSTWGTNTRRKRKAPIPPSAKHRAQSSVSSNLNLETNALDSTASTSESTHILLIPGTKESNDEESKVELKSIKKLPTEEEFPMRNKRESYPCGALRRNKSTSRDRMLLRPCSCTNSIFANHSRRRFQCGSEHCINGGNKTNKTHVKGKKKAPAPPNPFGDPDDEEIPILPSVSTVPSSKNSENEEPEKIIVGNSSDSIEPGTSSSKQESGSKSKCSENKIEKLIVKVPSESGVNLINVKTSSDIVFGASKQENVSIVANGVGESNISAASASLAHSSGAITSLQSTSAQPLSNKKDLTSNFSTVHIPSTSNNQTSTPVPNDIVSNTPVTKASSNIFVFSSFSNNNVSSPKTSVSKPEEPVISSPGTSYATLAFPSTINETLSVSTTTNVNQAPTEASSSPNLNSDPAYNPTPTPTVISGTERDDEIAQNILNDRQEQEQQSVSSSTTSSLISLPTSSKGTKGSKSSNSNPGKKGLFNFSRGSSQKKSRPVIEINDVQEAQTELEALLNSSGTLRAQVNEVDEQVKAQLVELKKESDKSSLLFWRSTSVPLESQGPQPSTSTSTSNSSKGSPRPWYKRSIISSSSPKRDTFGSKPKIGPKPSILLPKFSDLDREATQIVEENKRRSAEMAFNQNAKELINMFNTNFEVGTRTVVEDERNEIESVVSVAASSPASIASSEPKPSTSSTLVVTNGIKSSPKLSKKSLEESNKSIAIVQPQTKQTIAVSSSSSIPPTIASTSTMANNSTPSSTTLTTTTSISTTLVNLNTATTAASPFKASYSSSLISKPLKTSPLTSSGQISVSSSISTLTTTTSISKPLASISSISTVPKTTAQATETTSISTITVPKSTTISTTALNNKSTPLSTEKSDWTCSRCTLKNSKWRALCEACYLRRDTSPLQPSAMTSIFERVNNNSSNKNNVNPTPSTLSTTISVPKTSVATYPVTTFNPNPTQQLKPKSSSSPSCENFLSQLPSKEVSSKETKLQGMKLNSNPLAEDPELEELDIQKLRQARLAFFVKGQQSQTKPQYQHQKASQQTSYEQTKQNNLATQTQQPTTPSPEHSHQQQVQSQNVMNLFFEDGEDDSELIDSSLLNRTAALQGPNCKPSISSSSRPTSSLLRYRPMLESISEAESNYYYSAREFDRIYENWQLNDGNVGGSGFSHFSGTMPTFPILQTYQDEQDEQEEEEESDFTQLANNPSSSSNIFSAGSGNSQIVFDPNSDGMEDRRRLTYQDYLKLGAIPKGYSFEEEQRRTSGSGGRRANPSEKRQSNKDNSTRYYNDATSSATASAELFPPKENTVGVAKLLRKLEWAIAHGEHRIAAMLAHDLALLKVNCVVANPNKDPITIRVYVEDRFMQQGPFLVQVLPSMSVKDLKSKIEGDWGIPFTFQKWIIGKRMAENDSDSLSLYEVQNDTMAFLYLVTPQIDQQLQASINRNSFPHTQQQISSPPPLPSKPTKKESSSPSPVQFLNQRAISPSVVKVEARNFQVQNIQNNVHTQSSSPTQNGLPFNPTIGLYQKPSPPNSLETNYDLKASNNIYEKVSEIKPFETTKTGEQVVQPLVQSKAQVAISTQSSRGKSPVLQKETPFGSLVGKNITQKPIDLKIEVIPERKSPVSIQQGTNKSPPLEKLSNVVSLTSKDKMTESKQAQSSSVNGIALPSTSTNRSEIKNPSTTIVQKSNGESPAKEILLQTETKSRLNQTPTLIDKQRPLSSPNNQNHNFPLSLQQKLANLREAAEQAFGKTFGQSEKNSDNPKKSDSVPVNDKGKSLETTLQSLQSQSSNSKKDLEAKPIKNQLKVKQSSRSNTSSEASNSSSNSSPKLSQTASTSKQSPKESTRKSSITNAIKQSEDKTLEVQKEKETKLEIEIGEPKPKPRIKKQQQQIEKNPVIPVVPMPIAVEHSKANTKIKTVPLEEQQIVLLQQNDHLNVTIKESVPEVPGKVTISNPVDGYSQTTLAFPVLKSPKSSIPLDAESVSRPNEVTKLSLTQAQRISPVLPVLNESSEIPNKQLSPNNVNLANKVIPNKTPNITSVSSDSPNQTISNLSDKPPCPPGPNTQNFKTDSSFQNLSSSESLTNPQLPNSSALPVQVENKPQNASPPPLNKSLVKPTPSKTPVFSICNGIPTHPPSRITIPAHFQQANLKLTALPSKPFVSSKITLTEQKRPVYLGIGRGSNNINTTFNNSPQPFNSPGGISSEIKLKSVPNPILDMQASSSFSETNQPKQSTFLLQRKNSDSSNINLVFESKSIPLENLGATALPLPVPEDDKKEDNVQTYLKMLELIEKQDLILTQEDIECPVCFLPVPSGEGVTLRDCLHNFCKECLTGAVQYAEDSEVKCPFRDKDYSCNSTLQEREIKALVPPEVFEKYLARSVKLAECKMMNTFHCRSADCTGWCIYEDDVNIFKCPVCLKRNCLTCAAIHESMDCHQYQRQLAIASETDENARSSRLMLEKMIERGEALDCPQCHVVLLKKWGCDWVKCSYCKCEICWVTKGFRWGRLGKGDMSGGCKCGLNGVKCHPKCTYCH